MINYRNYISYLRKANKPKFTLSVLTYALFINPVIAYEEPGILGNISSWETPEYHKDWGLRAIKASTAYAMGITGKNIKLGFMDSGLLTSHSEFQGNRFFTVIQSGAYGKDGMKYPDAEQDNAPFNKSDPVVWSEDDGLYISNLVTSNLGNFKKGEKFNLDGSWMYGVNDAHGVNVASVLGANRDGNDIHGIAFNAHIYSANTGGNDNMTYGPTQDYQFFLQGYNALAEQGVKFINNSWGSNRRLSSAYTGATGWDQDWVWNNATQSWELKAVESSEPYAHMNLKDLDSAKKAYYQFVLTNEKSFIDAAYEVAKDKKIIQVFTAGNRTGMKYPFTRAMLPYFRPDIENLWLNITGQDGDQQYPFSSNIDQHLWNESRGAKWWTIAAPANNTRAANVNYTDFENLSDYGKASYIDDFGGTSGAAPHVTAALGLVQERYPYMSPSQARDVLLTTARQTKLSNSTQPLDGWTSALNTPDDVWGWGIVDVGSAMFGPKQFLGTLDITIDNSDIWSNDISDIAIKYRKTEDESEKIQWAARKIQLSEQNKLTSEEKAELEVENARAEARNLREAQGYEGSLIKRGDGTLTLTGSNTFTGTTEIYKGTLIALNQSIGNSKQILVENGASLEIRPNVDLNIPSTTGWKTISQNADSTKVNATIKEGGTFIVNDGVKNLALTFENNSILKPSNISEIELRNLSKNTSTKLSYTVTGEFSNIDNAIVPNNYAFFDLTKIVEDNKKLTLVLKGIDMEDIARSNNEKIWAKALKQYPNSLAYEELLFASKQQANTLYDTLSNDRNFMIQDHTLIDSIALKNHILNQKHMQKGHINPAIELWTSTAVHDIKSKVKNTLKTNSMTQLLGIDVHILDQNKIGLFIGGGKSKNRNNNVLDLQGKQIHMGIYSAFEFDKTIIKSGLIYSHSKQDLYTSEKVNTNSNLTTLFTDIGYKLIDNPNIAITPYMGLSYTRVKLDDIKTDLVAITNKQRNVGIITFGIRPSIPFKLDKLNFSLNADIAYNQLFGNKSTQAHVQFSDISPIQTYSQRLDNFISSKLGIEALLSNNFKVGLSYVGSYTKDIKLNGGELNFNFSF